MKTAMSRVLISMLVVFMMVVTVLQPTMSMENKTTDVLDNIVEYPSTNDVGENANEPITNGEAPSKKLFYKEVVIATTNIAELANYLSAFDYEGKIGTAPSNRQGIAFPVLNVPPEAIEGIAGLSNVMGVYDYVEPAINSEMDGTTFSRNLLGFGPNSPIIDTINEEINAATLYHGAEDAWANGFTGEGVQIATITTGTDFGNMELRGNQAIVDSDSAVSNEVIVEASNTNTTTATLDMSEYYELLTIDIYVNEDLLSASAYTITNNSIEFDPLIGPGNWINASYTFRSPYFGYPIAYDPTSMASYIDTGELQTSTLNPGDSWYVNTSSTDNHVYHTVLVDGVNDFWAEENLHGSSESVYPLSLTSELRAEDPAKDIGDLELDLKNIYSASDSEDWYFGFEVTSENDLWTREYDVNYGLYIDTDNVPGNGAATDPEGNYINTSSDHMPEYAIYFHHTSVDWGFNADKSVWTFNNTVQNATFYAWNGAAWYEFTLTEDQPYNATQGIGTAAGSYIFETNAQKYVWHDGEEYKLLSDNTILMGTTYVGIEILNGEQEFTGDFVEFSVPKKMMAGDSFSMMLFSVGENASHAQDTVPSDANVAFEDADWASNVTQLESFFDVGAVAEYVVTGIPSASGNYRFGLHPDQNLMNQHYGRPVAVLVTDMYVSGEYNAVYVDLDNDKDFTDEIPAMNRGVYNDSENINPLTGFFIQEDNTVLKDGVYYPIMDETIEVLNYSVTDEVLVLGSVGNEWNFTLANQNITVLPTLQRNYTDITVVENENSYTTVPGDVGLEVSFNTFNAPLLDLTLYVYIPGDDTYWLEAGADYTVNLATGEINTIFGGVDTDWEFYTWYNYSADTTEVATYTIDVVTGELMLDAPLMTGDDLIVLNYSYNVTNIIELPPFINYLGQDIEIEFRDWASNKDIDADGGTGDGMSYPDLSGGMVYFISNGESPIPYSDIYWEWNSIEDEDRKIPENGDLVAFFGEFEQDTSQGTEIGSAICAHGDTVDGSDNPLLKGMAPDAKLMSIRGGAFGSWYFAVEGYDGVVGTNDDAQIVTVTTNFPVDETGWDIYTKGAEYIGSYYAEGKTIFIAGTADNGFGYGTTASPGSSNATITSGQGTQFDYRRYNPEAPSELARVYGDGGDNPSHGDVLPSSGRGPNMLGNPEPDVITAGAFLFGATPLNIDQDVTTPGEFDWFGGQWAWDLWSGSALSASSTAGIMALIYDAYEDVNNEFPDIHQARSLIRSGADNLNYDALVQGAGMTNADRSTKLAADMDGLYLDRTYWVPGDYRGVRYEGFVKLMEPGESATETITIENKNQVDPAEITIYDSIFHKFGEYSMDINITKTYDDADIPAVVNIEPFIAVGTELLKVTVTSERKATMQTYMAEFFDWTDLNENGNLEFPTEQNRISYVIGTNSLELRYRDPLGRVNDGLAVQVKGFGGTGEALEDWTLHIECYEKIDWNWLSVSGEPTSIPAGASDTFDINLDIPADAEIGSYEGAVYINQKAPEELIATGVGLVMEDVPFKLWFNPPSGAVGIINDNETSSGNRAIVPQSSKIKWNGTTLYEGVDYVLDGTGGSVKFMKQYPALNELPKYVPYFNITYLTVDATMGNPDYNASWFGQVSIPNFVKNTETSPDNIIIKKDNAIWHETEDITDEAVLTANGGELTSSLFNKNIVRETTDLSLNGMEWPQDGGIQNEQPVSSAFAGQNYAQLNHGNVVPGTADIYLNSELLPQSDEVSVLDKEEANGLNSTSTTVSNLPLTESGADNAGSIWEYNGFWYTLFPVNSIDTPDFTILKSLIYENGIALIPGLDFTMHSNDTHGKVFFKRAVDPGLNTYKIDYEYYNHTITTGQLSHGQVVSESYKIYRNGGAMKVTEYSLDLETGIITMTNPLGPNEIIEAAYRFNLYKVDVRTGYITITDPLMANDVIDVNYQYFNWTVDLPTGVLEFADSLTVGDVITANYTYANYTLDMMKGIVKFSNALLPGENVTCEYFFYSNVIPVFFNIGADKPDFEFGGMNVTTVAGEYDELYKYNEIRGGYGGGGDWKYIYLDIKEAGMYAHPTDNQRLFVDIKWEYDQTDVDVQVYGGRQSLPGVLEGWPYDSLPGDEFGPHTIGHVGGSDVTADFFTTSGGPEEIVSPKISAGLNVIGIHTVGMNGSVSPTEQFLGSVGTMYVEPPEISIVTNQYVGSTQIDMTSNKEWKGVGGIAAGPSAPESLKNLTITQDDPDWSNYDTFEDQLASGNTVYSRTIKDCLIFHVHIWGHDNAPDLDLGVFLDGSGEDEKLDGKVQVDEFVAYGADADADEEVKLIAPKDGTYLIVPFGFTLTTNPALFDMDITIVQGTGFDLQGKGINSLPDDQKGYFSSNQTEKAFNQTYLTMAWDLPGSATGTLQGALYIGPGNGPMCMLVPIELTIDTDAPLISDPSPSEGAYINNQKPEIAISVSDFDRGELMPSSMKLYLDDVDVTMQSGISIPEIDDEEAPLLGYVAGVATYIPNMPLIDGAHVMKASIMDEAGNTATKEWAFTVDSAMPSVEITYPADTVSYIKEDTITITGTSEAEVELKIVGINNAELTVESDGTFSGFIPLVEGENSFIVRATDLSGNVIDITRTVYMDNEVPEIDSVRFSNGYVTNKPITTMEGTITEAGTLMVDGIPVTVNSDGTFKYMFQLIEGVNTIHLEFADMAGNVQHSWYNVTLDTIAPVIKLTSGGGIVDSDTYVVAGSVEAGAKVFVNGKLTTVGTRQSGEFSSTLTISPGTNMIVIEAEDAAGNVVVYNHVVTYNSEGAATTNWGAIGLMIALLVVGLVLGLFFGGMLGGGVKEEVPEDDIPPEDMEVYDEETPLEEEMPEDDSLEEISEDEEIEDISEEDGLEPIPIDEEVSDIDEDMPEEVDAEPIPEEEAIPEEIEVEELEEEPVDISEEIVDEDPRIVKLKEAFESGKISQELYEKNLAKFQE